MNGLIAGALAAIVMWLAIMSPMIRLALLVPLAGKGAAILPRPALRIGR